MGRGRGKGKKQPVPHSHEDHTSVKEEKVPPSRRRGRPQKSVKDGIEEEEEVEKTEENGSDANGSLSSKDEKDKPVVEKGKNKKRPRENFDAVKEENSAGPKPGTDDKVKPTGYRQIGSRRKNKPRRAAEVGVECK